LEATVGQKNGRIDEGVASLEQNKNQWLVCDTHKNVRANRVETAQKNNEKKLRATSDVFKVEHCGSSLLTSNRKNEFGEK
jgi:hypothetical protein